jgi:hypothetical protein
MLKMLKMSTSVTPDEVRNGLLARYVKSGRGAMPETRLHLITWVCKWGGLWFKSEIPAKHSMGLSDDPGESSGPFLLKWSLSKALQMCCDTISI